MGGGGYEDSLVAAGKMAERCCEVASSIESNELRFEKSSTGKGEEGTGIEEGSGLGCSGASSGLGSCS